MDEQLKNLSVLGLATVISCWMPNREGGTTPFAAKALIAGFGSTGFSIKFRARTTGFHVR
jgi:hypothetical protein